MELVIHCDGGARGNPGLAAAAYIIVDQTGRPITQSGVFLGEKTNNEAEYYGVIGALSWVVSHHTKIDPQAITIYLDSNLLVNQLSGTYRVKSASLQQLVIKVKMLEHSIGKPIRYTHVLRENNKDADRLVNQTLDRMQLS